MNANLAPIAHDECKHAYEQLITQQQQRLQRARKWTLLLSAMFGIAVLVMCTTIGWTTAIEQYETAMTVMVMGMLFSLTGMIAALSPPGLTRQQYYSIPGATSPEHQHVCIFCGHHHEYAGFRFRNSGAWHHCAQCNKQLWYESPY